MNGLIEYINVLFNKKVETGLLPGCLGEGYIVPLHQKATLVNVKNYMVSIL